MTLTPDQVELRIEVMKEKNYWIVNPLLDLIMQNIDKDGVKAILSGKRADSARARASALIRAPYMPKWRAEQERISNAEPINGLEPAAAEALCQAMEQKRLPKDVRKIVVPIWSRIVATADRLNHER